MTGMIIISKRTRTEEKNNNYVHTWINAHGIVTLRLVLRCCSGEREWKREWVRDIDGNRSLQRYNISLSVSLCFDKWSLINTMFELMTHTHALSILSPIIFLSRNRNGVKYALLFFFFFFFLFIVFLYIVFFFPLLYFVVIIVIILYLWLECCLITF